MGKAVTAVTRNREPDEREQLAGRIMRELGSVADPATCFPPLDPTVDARALAAMGGQEPERPPPLCFAGNDASRLQRLARPTG